MGLMCNLPNSTFFSVAIRRPMRDMNCLIEQDRLLRRKCILSFKICHLCGVGRTTPWFRSHRYPTKSKTCFGSNSDL